jgi:hypothetical protein
MLLILTLAVVGAFLASAVGTVWYAPQTPMGRIHMQYLGFDTLSKEAQAEKLAAEKPNMPKRYVAQLGLSFLTSFFVVFVLVMSAQTGVSMVSAVLFSIMGWICFVVPTVGSAILWGNCDPAIARKKFLSDIGCNLVTILLIVLLTSLFL